MKPAAPCRVRVSCMVYQGADCTDSRDFRPASTAEGIEHAIAWLREVGSCDLAEFASLSISIDNRP